MDIESDTRIMYQEGMKETSTKDVPVTVRMSPELAARLRARAEADDRKLSAFLERILRLWDEREPFPKEAKRK